MKACYLFTVVCLVSSVTGTTIQLEPSEGILIPAPVAESLRIERSAYGGFAGVPKFSAPAAPSYSAPAASSSATSSYSAPSSASYSKTAADSPSYAAPAAPAVPSPSSSSSSSSSYSAPTVPSSDSSVPTHSSSSGSSYSTSSGASYSKQATPSGSAPSYSSVSQSTYPTSLASHSKTAASSQSSNSAATHSKLSSPSFSAYSLATSALAPPSYFNPGDSAPVYSAAPIYAAPQQPAFLPAPPCPKNYLFSCQPKLTPVGCAATSPAAAPAQPSYAGAYSHFVPQYAIPVVKELY